MAEHINVDEKVAEPEVEGRRLTVASVVEGHEVNASGHPDQLQRQYSIWSICGLALTIDNAWVALGGSIVVAVGRTSITAPPGHDVPHLLTILQLMVALRVSCTSIWPRAHTTGSLLHASPR
jgi:hypothetical protein